MDAPSIVADLGHGPRSDPEVRPRPLVRLEPFGPADFDRLIAWVPDERFLLQFAGSDFRFPLTRAQLEAHVTATSVLGRGHICRAVLEPSGRVVGHGELGAIDQRNRSAIVSRVLVGPPSLRGQGIGSQIVEQLLLVAFGAMDLHRVALHVFDFNRSAIACYERLGFQQEGTLRDARRHGQEYWNVRIMSVLKHEWETGILAGR